MDINEMPVEKIESLIAGARLGFERAGENKWRLVLPGGDKTAAWLQFIPDQGGSQCGLLKVHAPIAKLPPAAGIDFFKEIFRKNRDMGHGAFALAGDDAVVFVDTLQLENCDQNEFDATIAWLGKATSIFREKLDAAKLPYLDAL